MTETSFNVGPVLPTLTANRLRLRWLTDADVAALFAIFGDPEITRYWGFSTLPDLSAAVELLADIHRMFHQRTLFQWGIEIIETGELAGTCTLSSLEEVHRRADLGYALGRAYWGRGYMTEALPILLRFAFDSLNLHRIMADTDPRNLPSIRQLERLGFRREGYLREHYLLNGEAQDAIVFGLLRSESRHGEAMGTDAS
jgi:RimJ/RimL family protein N-acetyltransferase